MDLDAISFRRRLCEADLLTGAEGLAYRAVHGLPEVLKGWIPDESARTLRSLLDAVSPDDLTAGAAHLWTAAAILWGSGSDATLEQCLHAVEPRHKYEATVALRFVRANGMGIPTYAPVAARRLLAVSSALETIRSARQVETQALEEAATVLHGV